MKSLKVWPLEYNCLVGHHNLSTYVWCLDPTNFSNIIIFICKMEKKTEPVWLDCCKALSTMPGTQEGD